MSELKSLCRDLFKLEARLQKKGNAMHEQNKLIAMLEQEIQHHKAQYKIACETIVRLKKDAE